MIPLGMLGGARHAALTVAYVSRVTSSSTWDGARWVRTGEVGPSGETRTLLVLFGHGSNISSTKTIIVGGVESTVLAASPFRSYAQIHMVTIGPEVPSTTTIEHGDGAAMEVHILRLSGPAIKLQDSGNLSGSVDTISTTMGASDTPGLVVGFGRSRPSPDRATIGGVDEPFPIAPAAGFTLSTANEVTITATAPTVDYTGVVAVRLAAA